MNRQLFDLYRTSERFKDIAELIEWKMVEDFMRLQLLIDYLVKQCECDFSIGSAEMLYSALDYLYEQASECGEKPLPETLSAIFPGEICDRQAYQNFIENLELHDALEPDRIIIKKGDYRLIATLLPYMSIWLYYWDERDKYSFFKPMLLPINHDQFVRNCNALGIPLPPMPHPTDHLGCCMYYYDLCLSIHEFQKENQLTNTETCAAIYDFALMLPEQTSTQQELPAPTNVWLTGAGNGDFQYLDTLGNDKENINPTGIWACNERTRRGDIVVIYALSPRSHIHSIWRAKTSGIFNPFDYYHCRTTVCSGIVIPPITFKELKADPYFSQLPIVRKNLQGINGWELTAKDYAELLRFIEQKGGDTSQLPHLFDGSFVDFGTISIEKDVEENILIPALMRLGYTPADWVRQLSLKAGRKEKAIPDFVFFPQGQKHHETAPMVIEAKLDMSSMVEYHNAFEQVISYAQMLQASVFAVCDKERIVVYRYGNTIDNPAYENHWATIFADEVEGAKLKKIIGKEIIASL